jgi:hypothetical protein
MANATTIDMQEADLKAKSSDLPKHEAIAKELLDDKIPSGKRSIEDTKGGKATDFFIFDFLGAGVNSLLSLVVAYGLNPREWVKNSKAGIVNTISGLLGGDSQRIVNRVVEVGFMCISGTILTACMVPLVKKKEEIAYWINKKLGKDTDVLPDSMKVVAEPTTQEERIEQELKKRVNYKATSSDIWIARWTAIAGVLVGDGLLAKMSAKLEAAGKPSIDTLGWNAGQIAYDRLLPHSWIHALNNFFSSHGASIDDMKENNKENYDLLASIERKTNGGKLDEDRMMVADQTRMLFKEVGWTYVAAKWMQGLLDKLKDHRIDKEEQKALVALKKEGIIEEGQSVTLSKEKKVTIVEVSIAVSEEPISEKTTALKSRSPVASKDYKSLVSPTPGMELSFAGR